MPMPSSPVADDAFPPLLAVDGLSFAWGKTQALNQVCLTARAGEFTALLGPNGAGKTTLMSLLTRLFHAPQGRITLGGFDLKTQPREALSLLGVVFQQSTLDPDLSVLQNLRYFAGLQGLPRAVRNERISRELDRFGLTERQKETVRNLNGGHKRRVELARALLTAPRILILDEPGTGLDLPARQSLVTLAHNLAWQEGLAVLWTTHIIDEIIPDRDRLILLHQGEIRASGGAEQLCREHGCLDEDGHADIPTLFARFTGGAAHDP